MKRAAVPSILVVVVLVAVAVIAEPQQPKKATRIGYLSAPDPATDSARAEGIRQALRERGYIEEKTSPPSTDIRRGRSIGILRLRPSWCGSRLISSW